jgi:hypothetical protein
MPDGQGLERDVDGDVRRARRECSIAAPPGTGGYVEASATRSGFKYGRAKDVPTEEELVADHLVSGKVVGQRAQNGLSRGGGMVDQRL